MTASYDTIEYEVRERAAWITIARPEKLNALNRATVEDLAAASARAIADEGVRAIALTGAGEKAFVAGADIAEMSRLDAAGAQRFSRFLQETFDRLERSPKPVLAVINGFALGGGCELALACHLRIAADTARLGQPEINLGLIPGAGGTQRLPRLVGRGRALELILGGGMIDAARAERIGLVERVVPAAELGERAAAWLAELAGKSPLAAARALEAVIAGCEVSLAEAQRLEAGLFGLCFATEDMREGTAAFLAKRTASFRGR